MVKEPARFARSGTGTPPRCPAGGAPRREDLAGALENLLRQLGRNEADAGLVGDDDIARRHLHTRYLHGKLICTVWTRHFPVSGVTSRLHIG